MAEVTVRSELNAIVWKIEAMAGASVSAGDPCSCQNSVPDRPRKNFGQVSLAVQRVITPPVRPATSSW